MIEYGALTAEVTKAFSQVSVDDAIGRLEEAGIAHARLRARNRWREVDFPVGPIKAQVQPTTPDGDELSAAGLLREHLTRVVG